MIKEIHREELRLIHQQTNHDVQYKWFENNYCWNQQVKFNTVLLYENGELVMRFTNAHAYFDQRKPNELNPTDS